MSLSRQLQLVKAHARWYISRVVEGMMLMSAFDRSTMVCSVVFIACLSKVRARQPGVSKASLLDPPADVPSIPIFNHKPQQQLVLLFSKGAETHTVQHQPKLAKFSLCSNRISHGRRGLNCWLNEAHEVF